MLTKYDEVELINKIMASPWMYLAFKHKKSTTRHKYAYKAIKEFDLTRKNILYICKSKNIIGRRA